MDIHDKKSCREIGRTCACFNLRRAARLVTQRYEQALKSTGLKATQFSVLMAACYEDGILLTKMAHVLGMDRTTLTRNLNIVEIRGLVTVNMGEDKRERQISITPEGMMVLQQALPLWQNVQDEIVNILGREKWEGLLSGLHEVAKKM
ncbi:MAG: winged helix-turn-helix transcriptional regulator [Deltaproteobacteria bacterium]|nr:winged helix-turn-helix transcriptional regulator [Deltaproteobacteria bacterium]